MNTNNDRNDNDIGKYNSNDTNNDESNDYNVNEIIM